METLTSRLLSLSQAIVKAERVVHTSENNRRSNRHENIVKLFGEEIRDHVLMPPPKTIPTRRRRSIRPTREPTLRARSRSAPPVRF
ncbi:hypothetical protein PROFUN_07864 [Planoprotostelium fungivorum]|uniref:Uncharacterized protein n=1 Tax=Planoprotostelium fungivorum TaxID=1890364 RepID=A0A2P6NLG6_9EUKA|nr:hypothetical protein PROFUN_07864 [Planoprotostelium fungivorum]